ncbi:MAG: glycosyltransferase family 4 protein [Paludibacteraceae bacterium]|nr:glycosyltransferase family 4 protein [Paludibacteraceae bacterium]
MQIAFDAKRAFSNRRGLGNYSRDVIRLMRTYAPQHTYVLCGQPSALMEVKDAQVCSPQGLWRWCPALWRSWGCTRQLKGVDVYHGLSGELPFGIHRLGIRTVVTIHDTIFLRYPHLYSATYRWLFTQKMKYAVRVADRIIAISEQTKRDIVHFFHADERKIRVVYQGCNAIYRQPVSEEQVQQVRVQYGLPPQYVLYVGALEERKNLHTLIEAMAIGAIRLPLVLVGAPSAYGERLRQLAEQKGVSLCFVPHAVQTDLPAIYKGAEVFVYPSIFEGFGIPILEAMCVGVPVVTSTGSCFAETGGNAALYANPLAHNEIAQALQQVVGDSVLRERMIRDGYAQAALFSDERVATNLIRVFAELE